MDVLPGIGLPFARLGDTLQDIESAVGPATTLVADGAVWDRHTPGFGAYFDHASRCQLIEVYASPDGDNDVTISGIQLVGRKMRDVVEDLDGIGRSGRGTSLTVDFDDGLALWSLGELPWPDGTAPSSSDVIVEGVAIAPACFAAGAGQRPPSSTSPSAE